MSSSDSSSSSTKELLSVLQAGREASIEIKEIKKEQTRRMGSRVGRSANRERDRENFAMQLDKDYFCRENPGNPRCTEREFELAYRMPRVLYENIRTDLMNQNIFWLQRPDATGKQGASSDVKLLRP